MPFQVLVPVGPGMEKTNLVELRKLKLKTITLLSVGVPKEGPFGLNFFIISVSLRFLLSRGCSNNFYLHPAVPKSTDINTGNTIIIIITVVGVIREHAIWCRTS